MKRNVYTAGLAVSIGFIVIEFDYFYSFLKNMWGDAFLSNCLTYKILVLKSSKLKVRPNYFAGYGFFIYLKTLYGFL